MLVFTVMESKQVIFEVV